MNDIPQSGVERDRYAIKVMQGVERDAEGDATNLQVAKRNGSRWNFTMGNWDWRNYDYRLIEPEVVMWANASDVAIHPFCESIENCKSRSTIPTKTHYIKRTTGGGRTIPQYEAVPLEDK